jgi:hypothetical protein
VEGTNTGQENAAGMASVGVRLTAELGHGRCAKRPCPSSVMALPLPERWRAPMGGQRFTRAPRFFVKRRSSSASNDTSITRRRWAVMAKPWLRLHVSNCWRGEDTAQTGVLIAEGQAAHLAVACGTWAPLGGEQAAEGLTGRLRLRRAPRGKPIGKLAPGLERSQTIDVHWNCLSL